MLFRSKGVNDAQLQEALAKGHSAFVEPEALPATGAAPAPAAGMVETPRSA